MKRAILTLLLFFSFLVPSTSWGENLTYYVSLSGNDSNPGTLAAPFRTVKYGVSLLQAGDTLMIRDGVYLNESNIRFSNSGTVGSPIIVKAENPGGAVLKGTRQPQQNDGGGIGFQLFVISNIEFDGLHIRDFEEGITVDEGQNHTFRRCIFTNNGAVGIQNWKNSNILVTDCQFIDPNPPGATLNDAIQDYGVNFYHTNNATVQDCYFYGNHNQAVSFKQDCHNGVIKRCIFEGSLYASIYLGQNLRVDGRPMSSNLTAEYNIVRAADGYRVKSPIRVDNVENAIVRYNYFEGFDETNNTSGINVWNEAMGIIEIYGNIIAFGLDNENSSGVYLSAPQATEVRVYNNTMYSVVQDVSYGNNGNYDIKNNLSFRCRFQSLDATNFQGDPSFIGGDPIQLPLSNEPNPQGFQSYYDALTQGFWLADNSPAIDFGVDVGLPYNGAAPDAGALDGIAPFEIVSNSLPDGTQQQAYSATLDVSGGVPPYSWSIQSGTLPDGLTLAASGSISGTPTTAGDNTFTVQVSDSQSATATKNLSITVNPNTLPLVITTASVLPEGTEQISYSVSLQAGGGVPPYSWSLQSGALPDGLTLAASGTISGTPTTAGASIFTVRVIDVQSTMASKSLSITVNQIILPLEITTASALPEGTEQESYSVSLEAGGGVPPYSWSLQSGTLPDRLTLAASGSISGTPTTAGDNTFTVQVSDSQSTTANKSLSITVNPYTLTLEITTATQIPQGAEQIPYSASLAAGGGVHPYSWSLLSGTLSDGLTLSASGTISGTPTTAGDNIFTVQVSDSGSATATKSLFIIVNPDTLPLEITTAPALPEGTEQIFYSASLEAAGGVPPYSWSILCGSFPDGLTLDASGSISGTPTTVGDSTITVQVSDVQSTTDIISLSIAIKVEEYTLLFSDDFNDGNKNGWQVVDEGTNSNEAKWLVNSNGILVQKYNRWGGSLGSSSLHKPGTYVLNGSNNWTDYELNAKLLSKDNDVIGIMFRFSDSGNYYRFSMSSQYGYRRLSKRVSGTTTLLAEDNISYTPSTWYNIKVAVAGNSISVYLNDMDNPILTATDSDLTHGKIGLYCWANEGSKFDNIVVNGK